MSRSAEIIRNTSETKIKLFIDLDGRGASEVDTGIGFFDHMLISFAKHGFFDLRVKVDGDLHVDSHHTIEDTGIVLGEAIKQAAGDKKGIKRYGSFVLPMDETLVLCGLDLSGRPYFDTDLSFIRQLSGTNNNHMMEAAFKAFAKALDEATGMDPRIADVLSTKGAL